VSLVAGSDQSRELALSIFQHPAQVAPFKRILSGRNACHSGGPAQIYFASQTRDPPPLKNGAAGLRGLFLSVLSSLYICFLALVRQAATLQRRPFPETVIKKYVFEIAEIALFGFARPCATVAGS
jgi:hypothetical protein